jgi:hypothetical protein
VAGLLKARTSDQKGLPACPEADVGAGYSAQVSMANTAKLYRALLDGLEYRGVAFFQCFTTCQPEHGVADDMSTRQARQEAFKGAGRFGDYGFASSAAIRSVTALSSGLVFGAKRATT